MFDKDMANRIKTGITQVKQDLLDAQFLFEQGKYRDCIQKLFQVYEVSLNVTKDCLNGRGAITEHEEVTHQFKVYSNIGMLNNDYSENHKRLDQLRKMASFGPYVKFKPSLIGTNEIKGMLEEAKSLVKEVNERVKRKEKK